MEPSPRLLAEGATAFEEPSRSGASPLLWGPKPLQTQVVVTGTRFQEGRRVEPHRGAPGLGGPLPSLAGSPAHSSVVDAVELDAAADSELPQPLQGLLPQAGGPQALPVERQLQASLLAQEKHLGKAGRGVQVSRQTDGPPPACRPTQRALPSGSQRPGPRGTWWWERTGLGHPACHQITATFHKDQPSPGPQFHHLCPSPALAHWFSALVALGSP